MNKTAIKIVYFSLTKSSFLILRRAVLSLWISCFVIDKSTEQSLGLEPGVKHHIWYYFVLKDRLNIKSQESLSPCPEFVDIFLQNITHCVDSTWTNDVQLKKKTVWITITEHSIGPYLAEFDCFESNAYMCCMFYLEECFQSSLAWFWDTISP